MSNKLNDIQAAAYFKDEKIKKLNQEEKKLMTQISDEDKSIKTESEELKKVKNEANLLKLKVDEEKHVIQEQKTTIQNLELSSKTERDQFNQKILDLKKEESKERKILEKQVENDKIMLQDEKKKMHDEGAKEQSLESQIKVQ